MCLKYTSLINIKQRGWDDKKLWQPSANKSRFHSVSMRKQFLKIVKNMQFWSVRVLGVQMRFMMEADKICCIYITLTAYFFKTNLS